MAIKPKELLKKARENRGFTQTDMAALMEKELEQTYSLRQYQRLEDGGFPKYKKDIILAVDRILGTSLYDIIYDKSVPRELPGSSSVEDKNHSKANGYLERRRGQKLVQKPYMVPLVPVKAQAGYARAYNNTDFISELELYPILRGVDPRGAVWRYFEIQGDSMEPALFETDLVLVNMVPHEDWKDIRKGQVYVIVTDEDVLIKIVYPKDKDHWILKSSNARHKDRIIAIANVRELWFYRRHVTSKLQLTKK